MGAKTQREKRRRRARGHGATIKIERKKMLTPLAWLKETDTVATHAQAKRDITHSAGYTVHVYPISLNYNTSC